MAKFCGKCGGKLDDTGLCPNCQANAPAQPPKEPPKADDKQGKKPGKKKTLTIIIAAAVLVLIIVAAVLIIPKLIGGGKDPDSTLPGIDADAYYEENSYVLEVIDAKDSEDVPTEKNAVTLLTERGFDQYPIEAEFNMDGDVYFTDGPCVHKMRNGSLAMLWSSWSKGGYAVGTAVSPSGNICGPWEHLDVPLFPENGGHGMLFRDKAGQLCYTLHYPNDKLQEHPIFEAVAEKGGALQLVNC